MPEAWSFDLDMGEPPPHIMEYAREHLNETPETRTAFIDELRDIIYERGEVTPRRMDDAYLLRYLRARAFHVEKAHRLMVKYYNFKEKNRNLTFNVEPLKLTQMGDDDVLSVPPYRDQNGHRISIYRLGNWDPNKYSIDEIFKGTIAILELGLIEPQTQIMGGIAIFDLENLSMQQAWQITPSVAIKVMQIMVTSFPMKTQFIHIINQSWIFDSIYGAFKPFLDARMRKRIFFHGTDMESLHKHIKPSCLPERYGGTRREHKYITWFNTLKNNLIVLREMKALGYKFDPKEVPHDPEEDDLKI